MRTPDLLKLVCYGDFDIIRTRIAKGRFEIKRLKAAMVPVWIIWHLSDNKDFFDLYSSFLSNAINISRKLTTKDMDRIQEKGFRIIRKYDAPYICIKERKQVSRRWIITHKFKQKKDRNDYIDRLLNDNYIILVD